MPNENSQCELAQVEAHLELVMNHLETRRLCGQTKRNVLSMYDGSPALAAWWENRKANKAQRDVARQAKIAAARAALLQLSEEDREEVLASE